MAQHYIFSSLLPLLSLLAIFSNVISQSKPVMAVTLHTDSRWIVNEAGQRVKLACVNWVSHMDPMVAEGLNKQPLDAISKRIVSMGFNCVRFTWPLYLVTNDSLASLTVRRSFQILGLSQCIAGIQAKNPSIIDVTLIRAFRAVVSNLGANNLMVILDNHVSQPGWCCSENDGNGFFGDKYFNPELWIKGLTMMATMFKGVANVVGMSLRNEPRGPRQNAPDWYRYMPKAAEAVHLANPNVLVILSGMSSDTDLSFLQNRPVKLTFTRKLVFEVHRYGFTDANIWKYYNPNQACAVVVGIIMRSAGFLLEQGYPLFFSEFGMDLRGNDGLLNQFMNCFFALAADLDFDWNLWTLGGSYYIKQGITEFEEYYGLLLWNSNEPRNSSFVKRLSAIQTPFQGPGLPETNPHQVIFHPSTGLCVQRKSPLEPLRLGPCKDSEAWSYTPQKTLSLKGKNLCLQVDGLGKPAKLGNICSDSGSQWETISDSKLHLSSTIGNATTLCLDVDSSHTVITNTCHCVSIGRTCDPESQWFKLIRSSRSPSSKNS
ncbi:glycosyl hydrolase 5 family protein-like [Quercus lobata]|uniref:Ricin B lectin domain-containing protein n=1 Tax=Quercus lobata TaxID=97700 RepID=A0A7N2LAM3_QUELO|nr:glycosyl hydrolase 5 family protein-like [Quercus lobata]